MRMGLVLMASLLACNGNGLHDVKNGGDAGEEQNQDLVIDTPKIGVYYCIEITGVKVHEEPCFETVAKCERNRVTALTNRYEVTQCQEQPFAMCFHAKRDQADGWFCRRTLLNCDTARKRAYSNTYEVTRCMRIPPEGWQKSSHRLRGLPGEGTQRATHATTTRLPG